MLIAHESDMSAGRAALLSYRSRPCDFKTVSVVKRYRALEISRDDTDPDNAALSDLHGSRIASSTAVIEHAANIMRDA